ncbi:hypothetical protein [Psychroflexus aestuariivivens]|uniref:hypothetical protein n=1 Tax=Psychroflexus aestuariivivens TaxID=1795040 RepID=UPI000FD80B7B|nr:hypothetical protein [Psychroflexus aestuariivivens]
MKHLYFLSIFSLFILVSCNSKSSKDSEKQQNEVEKTKQTKKSHKIAPDHKRLYKTYADINNLEKFNEESEFQYNIEVKFEKDNSKDFSGTIQSKTDFSDIKLKLDSGKSFFYKNGEFYGNPKNDLRINPFEIINMTSLPFAMQNLNYEAEKKIIVEDNDKKYNVLSLGYEDLKPSPIQIKSVTSSATTNLLQSAKLETKSSTILENGVFEINFDRYITVNKIPIALNLNLFSNEKKIATITVSRISYPKAGSIDFSIPNSYKVIQSQNQIN